MPKFKSGPAPRPRSVSPERLFDDLPRRRDGVPSLWAHQADMLRQYHPDHVDTPDVALELPTGSGKTLPALLIAEWRRTALGERVAYACPTIQLAHQVKAEADRQGIEAVALLGSHRQWDTADSARYEGSRAVAITTYSTVFNSNPALTQPALLLFDDAHAAESVIAQAYSVSVGRFSDEGLYTELLSAFSPGLSGMHIQRLQDPDPDPQTRRDVKLLPIGAMHHVAQRVDDVLSKATGNIRFSYGTIRPAIDRCLAYIAWDGFLIRPYIVPTAEHDHFANAKQRVYLSATLGDGGELERAFGRGTIKRLPVPTGWEQRGSGRRFFVFPELVRHVEPRSFCKAVISTARKALVIAPSDRLLDTSKQTLVPGDMTVFGKGDIERSLDEFGSTTAGVLALANRYDGIDLADDACRVTVLDGLPGGEHLQERFLIRSLRAGRVLEERLRTRVIQGAGRCTRGLKDHSVVVVLGDDLTRFLQRREVVEALRQETQAEVTFGINNSDATEEELLEAITSCLAQDDDWQNEAEPMIAGARREAIRTLPDGTSALAASVRDEVKAWHQIWRGDYEAASTTAIGVAQQLTDGALTPYRALWLYFAATWLHQFAVATSDESKKSAAAAILRRAHQAARRSTWLKEIAPLPPGVVELEPDEEAAIQRLAKSPIRSISGVKWADLCSSITAGLAGTDASPFEVALSDLGALVGAEAFKPEGKGRADSVWLFGDAWWLTLEAKTEADPGRLVSMSDVRQANTQLKSLSADRDTHVPAESASVVVTPNRLADKDAVAIAEPHVHMCDPAAVQALAADAIESMRKLRATAVDLEGEQLHSVIAQTLADFRLLPGAIRERLADRPISG